MSSDYRAIGNEILNKLEIDPPRLGGALSTLNEVIRDCLERDAWNEVPAHCELAYELCDAMHGSEELRELSNAIDLAYAEGIFHAHEGISHLYQTEEAREKKNASEESEELARTTDCLEKSRQSFHGKYRDQWNESIICLSLGRLYRSQKKLNEALLAFQRSCIFSSFNRLSIERMQEIEKVVSIEIEKTRRLFSDQKPFAPGKLEELPPPTQHRVIPFKIPIIREIAAGREKPVSDDDITGHIQQTGESEFEFEEERRTLKVELLKGSRLTFLAEYDYIAVQISGDSMNEAREAAISPNDYVILRRKSKHVPLSPTSGDIVAVVFRDEDDKATLKRIYIEPNRVILKPESSNPEHQPRILRPEAFAGDNPRVAVVGIAIAVLKPRPLTLYNPIIDENKACKLAKTFFEAANFEVEPGVHSPFWVKNDSPEWQVAGKMPVYSFEKGQPVTGSQVARLAGEITKEDRRGAYAFIVFHERLVDSAVRRLWELKQRDGLIIIPIHTVEIRQTLLEPRSMPIPAYWKLVALKRQWSSLTDPYDSVNSLTDPQWFFGRRRWAIIEETLSNIARGVECLVIYGMRGAGKTTLLNQLALACQEQKYPVAKILCKPLSDQYACVDVLREIIQGWGTSLKALYPGFAVPSPSRMVERHFTEMAEEFTETVFDLAEAIQQQTKHAVKFVLILDEVDRIFPSQDSSKEAYREYLNVTQILKIALEKPVWARVFSVSVVAAMEYPWIHLIDRFPHNKRFQNPLYGRFQLKPVELFERGDWDDMVQTIGELAGLEYTPESLDVLYHRSSGHPEITRKLCSCLVDLLSSNEISSPITAQDAYLALSHFLEPAHRYARYLETTFWEDPLSTDLDAEKRLMHYLARKERISRHDLLSELLARYTESRPFGEKIRPADLFSKLLGQSPAFVEERRLTDALRHLVDLQIVTEDRQQGTYAISIPIYRDWIRRGFGYGG